MGDEFEKMNRRLEQASNSKEKDIAKRYALLLKDISRLLSKQYEKYEQDNILSYTEMAKHKRLEKLLKQIIEEINNSDAGLRNEIKRHLEDQFKESYYQTAYIIETSSESRLAYTTLKDSVLDEAINNEFTGLTLNMRLSKRRADLIYNMREHIIRGLVMGMTYKQMADIVKKELDGDLIKANRIVRTESRRLREEGSFQSAMHAKSKGIIMTKTWRAVGDERSRENHIEMDGTTIEIDEKFELNGREGDHPLDRNFLAKDVINCRCKLIKKIKRVEKPQDANLADLTYAEWQKERLK